MDAILDTCNLPWHWLSPAKARLIVETVAALAGGAVVFLLLRMASWWKGHAVRLTRPRCAKCHSLLCGTGADLPARCSECGTALDAKRNVVWVVWPLSFRASGSLGFVVRWSLRTVAVGLLGLAGLGTFSVVAWHLSSDVCLMCGDVTIAEYPRRLARLSRLASQSLDEALSASERAGSAAISDYFSHPADDPRSVQATRTFVRALLRWADEDPRILAAARSIALEGLVSDDAEDVAVYRAIHRPLLSLPRRGAAGRAVFLVPSQPNEPFADDRLFDEVRAVHLIADDDGSVVARLRYTDLREGPTRIELPADVPLDRRYRLRVTCTSMLLRARETGFRLTFRKNVVYGLTELAEWTAEVPFEVSEADNRLLPELDASASPFTGAAIEAVVRSDASRSAIDVRLCLPYGFDLPQLVGSWVVLVDGVPYTLRVVPGFVASPPEGIPNGGRCHLQTQLERSLLGDRPSLELAFTPAAPSTVVYSNLRYWAVPVRRVISDVRWLADVPTAPESYFAESLFDPERFRSVEPSLHPGRYAAMASWLWPY